MLGLTKRERVIFIFAAGVIAFSLILNFIILLTLDRFRALNQEINSCKLNLKKSLRLLAKKQAIQEDYNQVSSVVRLQAGQEEMVAIVLSQLEQISGKVGLRIIDVRPQRSNDLGRYKEILVELKQEGNIDGFMRFIYDIENAPYLLKIKKIQLNSKATADILQAKLIISKIFLP